MRKIFITYKEIQNIRGTFNVNGICYSTIETLLTLLECDFDCKAASNV